METEKIISAGAAGTSAMTLFSYAVSEFKEKNFKEPQVLGKLLDRALPLRKKVTEPAGWLLHYGVGFTFAFVYNQIWQRTSVEPTIKNGLVMGGLSGCLGIVVWDLTFKVHPNPPKIHLNKYYGHLFLAHLIFGAFAAIGYKKIKGNKKRISNKPM